MPREKKEEPVPTEPVEEKPSGQEITKAMLPEQPERMVQVVPPQALSPVLSNKNPAQMIEAAQEVARALVPVIEQQRLYTVIQTSQGPKKFVHAEGWTTMAAMLGLFAHVKSQRVPHESACIYEATAELRTLSGHVVCVGDSMCSSLESLWENRDEFQIRSMAETRSVGKVCRIGLSWIIKLAGYEPTPAEEMQGVHQPPPPPKPPASPTPAEPDDDPRVRQRREEGQALLHGVWIPPIEWMEWFDHALALADKGVKDKTLEWLHKPEHRKPEKWAMAGHALSLSLGKKGAQVPAAPGDMRKVFNEALREDG